MSSTKQLYKRKEPNIASEYFDKAIKTAKELQEAYYIVLSNIDFGDFCITQKDYKTALKSYLTALNHLDEKTTLENRQRVETRIQDLKVRLGFEEFEKLENEITNG